MFSNISIKGKILILSLITIVVISVAIAVNSIFSIKSFSNENIENYKKEAYAKKEAELKNYVSLAVKTVEAYHSRTAIDKIKVEVQDQLKTQTNFLFSILESEYEKLKGSLSEEALKFRLKSIVDATRYGQTGYFWINDTDSVIVTHPINPALNNKNMYEYKDKGGKQIFKEFSNVAKKDGEGFVDYVWPKPGFEAPQLKVSFVKLFKPYNWVIGTGEYVDDVTTKLQAEALKTISEMRYANNDYFWINDSSPKMIMHPVSKHLDGKDLSANADAKGKKLFVEMSEVSNKNKEGGLVKYWWDKPEKKNDPKEKFSYVQRFEPWDWIIGTGAYVDDIENDVALMQENTNKEINSIIINILLFSLVAIIIVYLVYSYFVNQTIIKPLENLNEAIVNISQGNTKADHIEKKSNDEIGKLVDSFNGYIAKLKAGYEEDAKVIENVDQVIEKVINGFYVYKIEKTSSNPQIQKLRDSINSMIDRTNENLVGLNNILIEYGNSNFSLGDSKIDTSKVNGIISSLAASTQLIGVTVSEFLSMIVTSGRKLNEDTNVLSNAANKLSASANEQAASLEETAAAVEEITSIVKSSVQKVHQMSQLASELQHSSKEGEVLASKTNRAMDDIDEQVKSINDAITVIDQIAFQTNILSLNAAVEAATAGEAGKGFAVVAQEVRNLASRSAEAAREIKNIVQLATAKANEGKAIANEMIGGYTTLNTKINETITLIEDVSQGSKEEEKGIIQINDTINTLDQATQVNANSATVISGLASEVAKLSDNLLKIADRAKFKEMSKKEIEDIDLVFKISKLKNDHIKFKLVNFNKVGSSKIAWSVTKPTECDLGKWLIEQENSGKSFTKTENWRHLKLNHDLVHNSVQDYINEDCKEISDNSLLNGLSQKLDNATLEVFKALDQLKKDNNFEESSNVKKTVSAPVNLDKIEKQVKPVLKANVSNEKTKIVSSKTKDDDEWESF
ncbi:cache domain-containing protein [Arcobacter cloacae]|uniref:Chemotaxis protein n=1 Tax=Arcobacter cloacae TaxID=1054034 RepID=A0A6M8N9F8_9BACT|nr:cache domain-containing protein [Arcobacter cloacae]QKF90698.1 Cache sensor-containing MCP-domain signal transduction protein [Arcobacter cloacae]RXI41480.1 chemotaxis protein [Arcobacter cloacae]